MRRPILASVFVLAAAGAASAKEAPQPEVLRALLACRGQSDDAARLACYDKAAAQMGEAEAKGDIVVIDKQAAEAAHREAFGLPLPSLDMLSKALRPDEVDAIEGVVKSARADGTGKWTLALEDGAVWRQIDGDLARSPRAGSKVRIRKGMIGSFLMNIDGQPAVKVHRDR